MTGIGKREQEEKIFSKQLRQRIHSLLIQIVYGPVCVMLFLLALCVARPNGRRSSLLLFSPLCQISFCVRFLFCTSCCHHPFSILMLILFSLFVYVCLHPGHGCRSGPRSCMPQTLTMPFFRFSPVRRFFRFFMYRPLLSNQLICRLDLDEVRRAPEDEALAPRNIEPIYL